VARGSAAGARALATAGLLLIALGLLFALEVVPMATVVVDTTPPQLKRAYFSYDLYFAHVVELSRDQSKPAELPPAEMGYVVVEVVEDNPARATISVGGAVYEMSLHQSQGATRIYVFGTTTPAQEGSLWSVTVNVLDKAGNGATWTFYALIKAPQQQQQQTSQQQSQSSGTQQSQQQQQWLPQLSTGQLFGATMMLAGAAIIVVARRVA